MEDRVWELVGDSRQITFSPAQVQDAIEAATAAVWLTSAVVDSKAALPAGEWTWTFIPTRAISNGRQLPVYTPWNPPLRRNGVLHTGWGASTLDADATVYGFSFPPPAPPPELEECVAYLAASFLLQDIQPLTAIDYAQHAEQLRVAWLARKRRITALGGIA